MEPDKLKDFDKLYFPLHRLKPGDDPFEKIPQLGIYPEFRLKLIEEATPLSSMILNRTRVLQFVAYVYDINSPLIEFSKIMERRVQAAKLAEFGKDPKAKDNKFTRHYEDVILYKNKAVNQMALRYCFVQKSPTHAIVMTYMEQLFDELSLLKMTAEPKDRATIRGNIDAYRKGIEESSLYLLSGDNAEAMYIELMENIENELLNLTPEDIAIKLAANKPPFPDYNPYEETTGT